MTINPNISYHEWCKAFTLREREKLGNPVSSPCTSSFLLSKWRQQAPFDQQELFERYLSTEGLTEAQFTELLTETPQQLARRIRQEPEWFTRFKNAYHSGIEYPANIMYDPEMPSIGFIGIVRPLVMTAIEDFKAGLNQLSLGYPGVRINKAGVSQGLIATLFDQLTAMLSGTMILELNVARLEGSLKGDTPEERFYDFLRQVHDTKVATQILEQYPVLIRLIVQQINDWLEVSRIMSW